MSTSRFYWLRLEAIHLAKLVNDMLKSPSLAWLTFRICHRYDDVIVDYRINFLTLITFLSTLCRRQFRW